MASQTNHTTPPPTATTNNNNPATRISPSTAGSASANSGLNSHSTSSKVHHNNNSNNNGKRSKNHHWGLHWVEDSNSPFRRTRRVIYGRILFVAVLCLVASILGFVAYRLLNKAEDTLAETQFDSITQRALLEAQDIATRRRWAGITMASIVSEQHPDAENWPFISFVGFERLALALLTASSGVDMGISPFVWPKQQAEWEEYVYTVYDQVGFPNGTGTSPFGKGIWGNIPNSTEPPPYNRYHDNTNTTTWGSPYNLRTPVFRTDDGAHPVLMYNPHSDETRGLAIDAMIDCVEEHPTDGENQCGVITDMIQVVKHNGQHGAAMFVPIFPRNDPTELVGFISTLMLLDDLIENAFGDDVSGIDAVFKTETQAVTYTVVNGVSEFVGEGDFHDPAYDEHVQSVTLTDDDYFVPFSPTYRLHLYPNADFYPVYETNNPFVASFGSVAVILITSLCFFLYDFFVRREFHAKRELLQARRQFMRFVSHEVRTPLNSICMGLELIQGELAMSLGYPSVESAKAAQQEIEYTAATRAATSNISSSSSSADKPGAMEEQDNGSSNTNTTNNNSSSNNNSNNNNGKGSKTCAQTKREMDWFVLTQEVQSNAQGAIDILNDLLNYDKIEQGNLQLEERIISIWDLLEKGMLEFKLPFSSKHVTLDVTFGAEVDSTTISTAKTTHELPKHVRSIKLLGDPVRITQVLRNLMSNALKFTPENGTVHVRAIYIPGNPDDKEVVKEMPPRLPDEDPIILRTTGTIQIVVSDTGAGMSKDQLAKLFRDGVQFNANQLQAGQGSGLGLFIAKGIVEQHSGTLTASSEGLGKGTSFTAVLPIWEPSSSPSTLKLSNSMLKVESEDQVEGNSDEMDASNKPQSLRVLVVDDVQSNRKLLCRLLENAGHKCLGADSGQQAVDMVAQSMKEGDLYDCVLMDYEMPGKLDGPAAAKEIRNIGCDVFIVGITGNVLPDDVAYFKTCGANDVLSKPVRLSDIDCVWMEYGVYDRPR